MVFVDPFQEASELLEQERQQAASTPATVPSAEQAEKPPTVYKQGIGKYINAATQ